jgi:hypothetical protein
MGQTAVCLHNPSCHRDETTLALWTGLCPSLHEDTVIRETGRFIRGAGKLLAEPSLWTCLSFVTAWTHPHMYGPDTCCPCQPAGSDVPELHRLIYTDLPWLYSQWLMHPSWSRAFLVIQFGPWTCGFLCRCFCYRLWGPPRARTLTNEWSIVGWSPMHPRKLIFLWKSVVLCGLFDMHLPCENTLSLMTCSISYSI